MFADFGLGGIIIVEKHENTAYGQGGQIICLRGRYGMLI